MRIGIVAQEQDGNTFGVNQDYLNLIHRFGTPVIISPVPVDEFWDTYGIDGLVLPGGSDVDTRRYRQLPLPSTYRPNIFLEYFDREILPLVIEAKLPIFGICRGLQTLNVHFGGSLWQHLWRHPQSSHKTDLVHEVAARLPNGKIIAKMKVNSFHHQAIWKLGKELESIADSYDTWPIIEGIKHVSLPIAAVQWHPERYLDALSEAVMKKLFS